MNKKVSILIACYNGEVFIDNCLTSCINQTYKDIEIIVVDDGSSDNSLNILNEWKNKYNNVFVYSQPNNGLGYTRNKLISLSNGYYYFFLDIDDNIPNNAIELLINNSNNFQNDIVVGRIKLSYKSGKIKVPLIATWRYTKNMTNGHYVKSNVCTPWGNIVKRDFFNSLNIKYIDGRVFEDIGVMTYLFLKSKDFKSIKEIVYFYNQWKSKTNDDKQLSSFHSMCFKKINDVYNQTNHLFSYLNNEEEFNSSLYKRYINGIFFQIIPMSIFLINNSTNDKFIKYITLYNIINLIYHYNFEIKFSKTFWKSLAYFYILIHGSSIFRDVKKQIFKHDKRIGKYIQNNNNSGGNKYELIHINELEQILVSNKKKIYQINIDNLNIDNVSNIKHNIYLSILIDSDFLKTNKLFNALHKRNIIPFITIKDDFCINDLDKIINYSYGFFIEINNIDNLNNVNIIIDNINRLKQKKIIGLILKKKLNLVDQFQKKVDWIYLY